MIAARRAWPPLSSYAFPVLVELGMAQAIRQTTTNARSIMPRVDNLSAAVLPQQGLSVKAQEHSPPIGPSCWVRNVGFNKCSTDTTTGANSTCSDKPSEPHCTSSAVMYLGTLLDNLDHGRQVPTREMKSTYLSCTRPIRIIPKGTVYSM
jgi:hypothetical protein